MSDSWNRFLRDVTPDWLKNKPEPKVLPVDISDCPILASMAVEYFRNLDNAQITGAQVAALFDLLINKGETPEDATVKAGLPTWPEWMNRD